MRETSRPAGAADAHDSHLPRDDRRESASARQMRQRNPSLRRKYHFVHEVLFRLRRGAPKQPRRRSVPGLASVFNDVTIVSRARPVQLLEPSNAG